MSAIDWIVFSGFLIYVVVDGLWRTRGTKTLEAYFAGDRSIRWWAAGLSIMATQASAITVIGTTGQGHDFGMEFIQMYLGLAFAMVLLSIFFVPMYRAQPILTAYEYLERRFGPVTRTVASVLFMVSRCLAFGAVLYVPGLVLATLLEQNVYGMVIFVGSLTTLYTMFGGVKAVIATDVKQMLVILGGLVLVFVILLIKVLPEFSVLGALDAAGASGNLNAIEFSAPSADLVPSKGPSFWSDSFNFWSGAIGGLFLMLAYFGCDQTQVQRILTNPTADESRKALLVSAVAKVPMQVMVLFIGVLLYLFYVVHGSPLMFNPKHRAKAEDPAIASRIADVEREYSALQERRRELALDISRRGSEVVGVAAVDEFRATVRKARDLRSQARRIVYLNDPENRDRPESEKRALKTPDDTNYVFPHFILREVPVVFLGLIMAAIFAAMMSSADSALNALTSSFIVDIYKRWFVPGSSESSSLLVSRLATVFWGTAATAAALMFEGRGSIIVQVNKVGSYFYGSLLGVFVLGLAMPRAGGVAGVAGLVAGMSAVLIVDEMLKVGFLWYNVIGCLAVLVVGALVAAVFPKRTTLPA